jgi:toxin ParE1/3/4
MALVSYRPQAELDLEVAFAWYFEHAGLEVGQRFYGAVFSTVRSLSETPGIGSRRWQWVSPKLTDVLVWKVREFKKLIFYRPTIEGIEVVRVLHGARDIGSELAFDG